MKPRNLDRQERKLPAMPLSADTNLSRKVVRHVERHIGPVEWIYHNLRPDVVGVDLLWVPAHGPRAFHTVVTCGMSARPIPGSDPTCECGYAELLLRLPASWPTPTTGLEDDRTLWPLEELVQLARFPHREARYLWGGHTVANGDPDGTLHPICEATRFCGSLIAATGWAPRRFRRLRLDKRRRLTFFSVIPLYAEELMLARDHGSEKLLDYLEHSEISDVVDPNRPNPLATTN